MVTPSQKLVEGEGPVLHHCAEHALTDFYGWFLQVLLACLAFTCLIGKRFCEPPYQRRPWLIWFFDTSKQGMGALVMHLANIYLAGQFKGDPCTWYIIHFLLDSSVGLFITWVGIRTAHHLARTKNWPLIDFGEYGKPPSTNAWFIQCCLYVGLMAFVKILITLLIQMKFWESVREFILTSDTNPDVEIVLVMVIIPFFVNILMFWVTDNFLMRKHKVTPFMQNDKVMKVRYRNIRKHKSESESDDMLLSDDDLISMSINNCQQRIVSA